jgi:hypothetical protein
MGAYSTEPDPPTYATVADTHDCVRYTNVAQAQWFMDRINVAFAGSTTNARLDGTTVKWFGYYTLPLGNWLYAGTVSMTDEALRASSFRPITAVWEA